VTSEYARSGRADQQVNEGRTEVDPDRETAGAVF
jgi:hypothetical protein